jgi:hypothetical protein
MPQEEKFPDWVIEKFKPGDRVSFTNPYSKHTGEGSVNYVHPDVMSIQMDRNQMDEFGGYLMVYPGKKKAWTLDQIKWLGKPEPKAERRPELLDASGPVGKSSTSINERIKALLDSGKIDDATEKRIRSQDPRGARKMIRQYEAREERSAASYNEPPTGVGDVGSVSPADNTLSEIFEKSPLEETPVGKGDKREQRDYERPRDKIPQKQEIDADPGKAGPGRSEIEDRYTQSPRESSIHILSKRLTSIEDDLQEEEILEILLEEPTMVLNSARNSYLVGEVSKDSYFEFKEAFDKAFSSEEEEDWVETARRFYDLRIEALEKAEKRKFELDQVINEEGVEPSQEEGTEGVVPEGEPAEVAF